MAPCGPELPLSGIKVLELGHTVMGPTTGLILADLGADVLKIERAPDGDDTRRLQGFGAGFFPCFNRNKQSLAIDLKSDAGLDAMRRLIKCSDVLVENFGPGAMDRMGLSYEECSQINPALIYCSLKGFMPGPYEDRPALDEVVQMMGGLAYMTGPVGRPLRAGASVTDILGGTFGAVGILTALYERQTSGKGHLVRASLFESVAFSVAQHMGVAAVTGEPPLPMPARGRTWSVYDLFETSDGEQVFLGVTSDAHWQRMCKVFSFDDWSLDVRLITNQARIEARDWFLPELAKRIAKLSKREVMDLALKAHIPFAQVARPQDLFDDPHLNESGGLLETVLESGRKTRLPKLPLRLDGCDLNLRNNPPRVGQGGWKYLNQAGLDDAAIQDLIATGTIGVEQ